MSRRSGALAFGYIRCVEGRQKRHRGPKAIWPMARRISNATRHLPHWAQSVHNAIESIVYETTIVREQRSGTCADDQR